MADLHELKLDRTALSVVKLEDADDYSDVIYWESQPYSKRLEALEMTRQAFYGDATSDSNRLVRVLEIIRLVTNEPRLAD